MEKTTRTNNKSRRTRRFNRNLRMATRLILMIATLVAFTFGTYKFQTGYAGKILYGQYVMYKYHDDISKLRSIHQQNLDWASSYDWHFSITADSADEAVSELLQERIDFVESAKNSDPILYEAVKNQGDYLILAKGLILLFLNGLGWVLVVRYFSYLIMFEEIIFFPLLKVIFSVLAKFFACISRGLSKASRAYDVSKKSKGEKIYKMPKKRVG